MSLLTKISLTILLASAIATAQTSNVTATITDPDGQTWNSGTFSVVFIPTPGIPGPYTWSVGTPLPIRFSGSMNASGVLSVSLPDNSFIGPLGSKWQFTLCGNTSAPCQNVVTSVTGASPNLSTALSSSLIAPRFSPGTNAFGYLDVEVIGPPAPGANYWNVTSGVERTWNGSAWITAAAGGPPGSPTGSVQFNNSGVFGGISSVAAGSAFVSNGVSSTPIFQTKPTIDLRDVTGIDCTAVSDSSATLATLFAAQKGYILSAGSSTGCGLKLASTVEPASTGAWAMTGSSSAGGFGSGNIFVCTMSATPCLWFDRQRDSALGNIFINSGSASAALQVSQLTATSGQINTNNKWHDMYISNVASGASAIEMAPSGDTTANSELQTFEHISISSAVSGNGIGFNINQALPNCRVLELHDVSTSGMAVGYNFGCASMHMIGGLQEQNTLDFSGNPTNLNLGGGFIADTHSESSKQWIANWGSTGAFGFLFNRNEMNTPDLTKFQWDFSSQSGNMITMGNRWGPNANVTKMVQLSTAGGSWVSIADQFPNGTKANLPDLSHESGSTVNIISSNRYTSLIVASNGNNGAAGTDGGVSGLYLVANDAVDNGSNQSFYTSPGFDISALFQNTGGVRVYVPWRFIVTGLAPTGANPTAQLLLKVDNDPITGIAPATTGALSMDFTGGVQNGGTLKLPLTSHTAIANAAGLQIFNTTTTCTTGAAVGSTCTTAAISLPVAAADTSYRITCTGKGPTAVPVVSSIANSSASQFTITIAALTAVAASYTSFDCIAGHN